ncbi:hypothetical protein L596_029379 [Steinernema carpocapsae]|nr:hypothetical protein L596_029379 [Steinernema carpocapsae]
MSTMAGHLLADKATNLVPAVMFMAPVALALLIDSDFSVNHGLASDRNHFLGLSAAIAFAATGSTALVTGSASFAFVLFTLSHLAWLAVHFQISMSAIMAKNFHQGDFEVLYVVALIVLYTAIALCTSGLNQATPVMPK